MQRSAARPLHRRELFALMALVALVTLARFVLIFALPLFPDEAIYALVAARAPLHFYTQPPGVALLIRAGEGVLGPTELGVRLPSLLLMTLALLPVFGLAREIGGTRAAFWSVIVVALVPIYFIFGAMATPDAAQLFCWALALYATLRALKTGRVAWWLAAGGAVCLGLYVKYTFALYFPSLLLCLLLSSEWRPQLRRGGIYGGLAVALLGFVPVAAWQLAREHDAALRYHLAGRHIWQMPKLPDILFYQAAHTFYISSFLYFLALAAMVWALWRGWRRRESELVFLGSFAVVTYLLFLGVTSFTARTLHREHWDAMAYLPALVAAVPMARACFATRPRRKIAAAMCLAPAALGLILLPVEAATGAISRALHIAPWFAPMLGWREMASAVDAHRPELPQSTPSLVLAQSGQSAVEYAFYGRSARVFTMPSQWNEQMGITPLFRDLDFDAASLAPQGQNAIAVSNPYATTAEMDDWDAQLRRAFVRVEPLADLPVRVHNRTIKTFHLRRCEGLRKRLVAAR
jgi:hypothetical protein